MKTFRLYINKEYRLLGISKQDALDRFITQLYTELRSGELPEGIAITETMK